MSEILFKTHNIIETFNDNIENYIRRNQYGNQIMGRYENKISFSRSVNNLNNKSKSFIATAGFAFRYFVSLISPSLSNK